MISSLTFLYQVSMTLILMFCNDACYCCLQLLNTLWYMHTLHLDFNMYCISLKHVFSCDQAALQMVFSICLSVRPSVCLSHLFSCDQAALWMVQSVRPSVRLSVRPSVCHTFLTMFPSSYHHEIFRSYYQWQKWRPCKRSRSEVKGQGHRGHDPNFRFRTVTPVWIHIWWWNDTYSSMLLRRGALLFFKVIRQISRSHGAKIAEFDPDWAFPDCNSSLNSPMAMKCCTKLEVA